MFGSIFHFLSLMKMSLMCRTIYDTYHRILRNAVVDDAHMDLLMQLLKNLCRGLTAR